jgi:hypothetical protein
LLLPLLIAPGLLAGEGAADAARDLARRLPSGFHGSVALTVRSISDLENQDAAEVRRVLENELRNRGLAIESGASDEVRVTLSQNFGGRLLVAELKRGDDRQVILVPWNRPPAAPRPAGVSVEKTLLLTRPEPVLDAVRIDGDLLVLQPGRIARFTQINGRWEARESAAFPALALPRDPRGRLIVQAGAYLAYLPGAICSGALSPLDARCRDAEEPWPLALRAFCPRGRNYFDGRVSGAGAPRSVPPFYAVAGADEPAGRLWIFTRLDGSAWLHDAALEPVGALGAWGSEIAGVAGRCGPASLVLAAQAGGGSEKDAIHVYQIVDRRAIEQTAAIDMPGPVTALWPAGENSVLAVARDISTGEYAAYTLAIHCGH